LSEGGYTDMNTEALRMVGNRSWAIALLCFIILFMPALSHGQEFPTKPINVLVGFAPGGVVDISGRMVAGKSEKFLGQPFVISCNGGGAGAVAAAVVATQPPDGYHLLCFGSNAVSSIPHLRKVPYKLDDFMSVMHYGAPLSGVAVRADSPWKTLKDLVEYARQNPGKIKYSTSGVGGTHHLSMEFIAKQEGIKWVHVPYPGGTPGLIAMLGGHVQANVSSSWIFHSDQSSIRPLGVHSEKRAKLFPNVPTFRESGYDFINPVVFMFAAPKRTPMSAVNKLAEAFRKGMEDPEFIQLMGKLGIEVTYRGPADTQKFQEAASVSFAKMVVDFNLKKE
jgi:tripartite-type tricarboxylate transporter receptor subunit TctC